MARLAWKATAWALVPAILGAGSSGLSAQDEAFTPLPTPSLNFYGVPGLIDMPSAEHLPDAQFTQSVSWFGGQTRISAGFQALPWLAGTFRYNAVQNWNFGGFDTYYDRGFDFRFRLLEESRYLPQVTVGLQDFVGTGIYAGEYVVATKNFTTPGWNAARLPGRLKITGGVGWGRLGSANSFGSPFGADRPEFEPGSTGGKPAADQWFRGPASVFGGLEWQPTDRLGFKVEYSTDAYDFETNTTSVFERKSDINYGVEYQASPRTRLGLYYLYGSELGVSVQFQLNPKFAPAPLTAPAPFPVEPRPARATDAAAYSTAWAASAAARLALRDTLAEALSEEGVEMVALDLRATSAELRFVNTRYRADTIAIGRAARVMARVLPASVETFSFVPMSQGLALSRVTFSRSDLERLEFRPNATEALRARTEIGEAAPRPAETALAGQRLYPNFRWSIGPYFEPSFFDPDQPLRLDVGIELDAAYDFAPGWSIVARARQRLAGNIDEGRPSNSVLPHVRTDQVEYAQYDTTLRALYVARQWRPGRDLYARASAGYLEQMYAGVAGEVLWKPVDSPLALGAELAYVQQRDFDQRFGLRTYNVWTGYASAYYELGRGYVAQLDVGQYLAGDVGATFTLERTFANGWSVGGWFTLTDVSSEEFGEGSFDKGIRFSIPVNWFIGKPSQRSVGLALRPIQRDGGQQLNLSNRLYGQVRDAHERALDDTWARVWE